MWHVHNSASSGGEDGGVWGWCLEALRIKESSWLAGSSVMGTRAKKSRELKRTREECGFWVLAKGQEGLTYPQFSNAFIPINCAHGQKEKGG